MIHTDPKGEIQSCLAGLNFPFRISVNHINRCYYTLFTTEFKNSYSHNFRGIGKLKNHQIKLHVNTEVKAVATPPRSVPYHLEEQVSKVIAPKTNGSIRMTFDARNVNKAIIPTNHPIPRHEDIKAKLAGCKWFSKMDFKSLFWQIELDESSRYLTVFHTNDKLYRYKRLTMGIKPAQGELNVALNPLFMPIENAHLIQ